MNKKYFLFSIITIAALLALGIILAAQESPGTSVTVTAPEPVRWYRSNASGLEIELIPSRLAAMRNEYCISVEVIGQQRLPGIIPRNILSYYAEGYRVEFKVLYENSKEIRRQWIFRDSKDLGRLAASGTAEFFSSINNNRRGNESEDPDEVKGFIELRNSEGFVTREFQYDADLSEWDFRYYYREGLLIRAETWLKGPPPPPVKEESQGEGEAPALTVASGRVPVFERLFTDYYRYSRSGSLRAIDRTIHEGEGGRTRVGFPALSPRITPVHEVATQAGIYTTAYFLGIGNLEGLTISYSLDSRGRILSEISKNEAGKTVGELRNEWSGDRLQFVTWKSGDDDRRIEFEYDKDKNPLVERNFRKGVLERIVNIDGDNEVEEIYMNGILILRAYWEQGLKISEERVTSGGLPR
jgi:hypothetical protein